MRLFLFLAIAFTLVAQEPPAGGEKKKGGPPPPPKNLKILKPEEVRPAMAAFRTGLGVQCTACHVEGNFASDDKPMKETARMMIAMTHEVNGKFPDGKMHVTCYTCHRGEQHPKMQADAPPAPPPAN